MKFLVLVLVVLVVVLLAKGARSRLARRSDDDAAAPSRPSDTKVTGRETMLACAHCGLHLPGGEALPGRGGVYCSEDHRAIAEARHGPG